MNYKLKFNELSCCVVIPTYNNEKTLGNVIRDVSEYTDNIIVVNDGSTDSTASIISGFDNIHVIKHEVNKGKGIALRNAFEEARELGYENVITIDSDGQHFAEDLPNFLGEIEANPGTLVIGARNMTQENVPGKSSFGNKFSNFWFYVDTGIKLSDTQSGYRLYPVDRMKNIKYLTSRFEFEVEVIVTAAWKGIPVKNIPIRVHYEPGKERISHFRPFTDFTRISILNTWFFILAVLYYIPLRFIKSLTKENIKKFVKENLLNKDEPIITKASSIGFGVFMGIFPVWGYQLILGITLAHLMKLNKALFVVAANISLPPLIPFIIYGSYRLGGLLVSNPRNDLLFTDGISFESIKANFFQYVVGAVPLAVAMGLLAFLLTYIYFFIRRSSKSHTRDGMVNL